jgi:SGNH hydrolase-like domain, acetyltransferase AlgX
LSRKFWFWPIYIVLLMGATLAGTEFIASFLVPPWPARDIRPISAEALGINVAAMFKDSPELIPLYSDWGVRDRPRTFARPLNVRFRSILIGDSFLEGYYVPWPLSVLIERRWAEKGRPDAEAINLGVAATGPRQYYYRIKRVALEMHPDAIVMFIYAGNDFIQRRLDDFALPALAEELPVPSILGTIAPRTDWLLSNRLGLSELGRGNKEIPGETALLSEWAAQPTPELTERVAQHMHQYYYPQTSVDTIREILSRSGDRFGRATDKKRTIDREFVMGWLLSGIIDWETGQWPMPRDADDADRQIDPATVDATLSWVAGAERLAKDHGVQLFVALAPVGVVDPNYVEFWRPWPKYFSYQLSADARHRRLAAALRQRGMNVIDLREDLDGVRGTYRLTDGHWTELGTKIVADRVSRALLPSLEVSGKRERGE